LDAARGLPNLSLEDALQHIQHDAERGSPTFAPAARRWLASQVSSLRGTFIALT
jgi:hypothetical protein